MHHALCLVHNRNSLHIMSTSPTLLLLLLLGVSQCEASERCGGKRYDKVEDLCCGGEIHEKNPQWMCCGGNWIFKEDHNCIFNIFTVERQIACGDTIRYDRENYVCCDNELHEKKPHWTCCGGDWISKDEQTCLFNVIAVGRKTHCQGSFLEFYNPNTEICCNGNVIKKSPTIGCCGGVVVYNPQTSTCEDNKVFELEP
ncbi:hypothetical protein LSAT2_026098 [Lamellibrachia satsuma]|nr:hypothetical protein LSAT2_026098 [Lamellibrachia satsuma]